VPLTVNVLAPNGSRLAPTGSQCSGTTLNFTAAPAGGNGTYTFNWNSTNPNTSGSNANFSYAPINNTNANIIATVNLSVTSDGKTCTQQFAPTILPAPTVSSITSNSVSCFGGNNGTATVVAANGVAPYAYVWSTNPVQNSATATGLIAGNYSVTVIGNNGCTVSSSVAVAQPAAALQIAITSKKNPTCVGVNDGFINTTVTGGNGGYTFLWSR
jgi:hypothetical protein